MTVEVHLHSSLAEELLHIIIICVQKNCKYLMATTSSQLRRVSGATILLLAVFPYIYCCASGCSDPPSEEGLSELTRVRE